MPTLCFKHKLRDFMCFFLWKIFNSLEKTLLKYTFLIIKKMTPDTSMYSFKEALNKITCKYVMSLWTDTCCLVIFWSYTHTRGLQCPGARMLNSSGMPLPWSTPQCDLLQGCTEGDLKSGPVSKLYTKDSFSDCTVEKMSAPKLASSFLWEQ